MLNAVSVPAKKPAFDQAPSTEPCEVAWIACSAGTSAPGSLILRSIVPAETRSIFFESLTGASPISVRLVGNALAMFRRSFCGAGSGRSGGGSFASRIPLSDARSLSSKAPEVIQLGPAHLAAPHHVDLIEHAGM